MIITFSTAIYTGLEFISHSLYIDLIYDTQHPMQSSCLDVAKHSFFVFHNNLSPCKYVTSGTSNGHQH